MSRSDVDEVPPTVTHGDEAPTSMPTGAELRVAPMELALLGLAALLILLASTSLPTRLVAALPDAVTVRSNGTHYPWLQDVVDSIVARTGYVLLLAVIIGLVAQHPRVARLVAVFESWPARTVNVVMAALAGAWYGWLSYPHNGFGSNARIHWVDIFHERADEWFYVAVKVPHLVFYDVPWLWRGITASGLVLALFALGSAMGLRRLAQVGLASTVLVSGNILLFAPTSEDVLVNLIIVTLFLLAVLRGGPAVLGLATFGLWLGRPYFIVLGVAAAAAHAVTTRRDGMRPLLQWALTYAGVVVGLVVASQVLITMVGRRFLFVDGMLLYSRVVDDVPQAVDGFVISPLSGTYALHLLWIFPAPLLVAATIAVVRGRVFPPRVRTTLLTCALGTALLVLVSEVRPLLYYNMRYLTYLLPLVLFAAWTTPLLRRTARGLPAVTLIALLALAPVTIPTNPFEVRQNVQERPQMELYGVRQELRGAYDGGDVQVQGARSSRNLVAYVLKADIRRIDGFEGEATEPGLYIVEDDVEVPPGASVVARTDSWVVFDQE